MAPDLLIIGDRGDRQRLARRVEALGYRALGAGPGEIEQALDRAPTAILLWAHEGEIRPLLARLRGHAAGEGIPVVLCGELGGEIRDLADVLELGADRFLVAPIDEDELRRTLIDLLGAAGARPPDEPVESDLDAQEVLTDPFGARGHDPLLDQLRRTLADLDERPEAAPGARERDDLDLTAMGLDAVPRIDADPAELADLSLLAAPPRGHARPMATLRIPTDAAVSPVAEPTSTEAEVSTALLARRRADAADDAGDLGDPPGLELLGRLHRRRFTGRLRLAGPSALDVWFVDGAPVHVESDDPDDRLSAGLARRGLLDATAAAQLHQRLPHDTLADGELLAGHAGLKAHEVADALADHLEELLLRGAAWTAGRWTLVAGEAPPAMFFGTCSLGHVLRVGSELELVADTRAAALRPRERRPLLRADAALDDLDPPPAIRAWAAGLDGRRTIDEVVAEAPRERLAWLRALAALGRVDLLLPAGDPLVIDRRRIEARLADARRGDHLALLGVDARATPLTIARAHRALSRTFAAERLEPATRERMAAAIDELIAALDRARDVLLDAERRAAYLAGREES